LVREEEQGSLREELREGAEGGRLLLRERTKRGIM
jgi:hypothetical protein